jgi:hypothetical protein
MFTIETTEEYEAALSRIEELRQATILDGPEAAELVDLLVAAEEWEADHQPSSRLSRAKPSDPAS